MEDIYTRTKLLIGEDGCKSLMHSHVAVFGLGGVGCAAVEALVRSGVGEVTIVDGDVYSLSNLNRQLCAVKETIGRKKTEVQKERILSINEKCIVHEYPVFYLPPSDEIDYSKFSYVIDALDTITTKLYIAEKCDEFNIMHISCMGSGNHLDPLSFVIEDIYSTSLCPLARVMRRECRKRGIKKLKVIISKEKSINIGSSTPGSVSFVPPVMGYIACSEAVKEILSSVARK